MATYTITLTDAEEIAMNYIAKDAEYWIENAVHGRARIAIDEIVQIAVEKCLQEQVQVPGSKDEIVTLASERGWIKTAVQREQDLFDANQALLEQSQG